MVLDEATPFSRFLDLAAEGGGLRHVVVTRGHRRGRPAGEHRPAPEAVRRRRERGAARGPGAARFTIVRATEVAFDVITTMWNRDATMAIVVSQDGGTERVLGVVTKEHVADTVARSIQIYPG